MKHTAFLIDQNNTTGPYLLSRYTKNIRVCNQREGMTMPVLLFFKNVQFNRFDNTCFHISHCSSNSADPTTDMAVKAFPWLSSIQKTTNRKLFI